jgi:hypothetical protein
MATSKQNLSDDKFPSAFKLTVDKGSGPCHWGSPHHGRWPWWSGEHTGGQGTGLRVPWQGSAGRNRGPAKQTQKTPVRVWARTTGLPTLLHSGNCAIMVLVPWGKMCLHWHIVTDWPIQGPNVPKCILNTKIILKCCQMGSPLVFGKWTWGSSVNKNIPRSPQELSHTGLTRGAVCLTESGRSYREGNLSLQFLKVPGTAFRENLKTCAYLT